MNQEVHCYDDIINLPHPTSSTHPRMPLYDRAAQFSPFAALTGHEAAVKETARLTDERIEPSEDVMSRLNEKLQILLANPDIEATITYFVPDRKKSGGAYQVHTGRIKRIDTYQQVLVMEDGGSIPMEQISRIECAVFDENGR